MSRTELEQPVIMMEVPDADMTLTPAQARRLTEVLLAKAEAVDSQPLAAPA